MLKKQGYKTAYIGKWHLGWDWALKNDTLKSGSGWDTKDFDNLDFSKPIQNGPKELGFDYSYGHSGSLDMAPYVYVENGMPTDNPTKVTVDKGKYTWWREGPTGDDFIHEDVTPNFFRKAITFVKENSNKEKPFFLYLPLPSPHTPILPTKEWMGKSKLNPYGDFVAMIDDYIGQLVAQVESSGISGNTIIVFTSDNGSPAKNRGSKKGTIIEETGHSPNGAQRGFKGDAWEGGHHIPFMVRWPGKVEKGSENHNLLCQVDMLATFAALTEQTIPEGGEDSINALPMFLDEAPGRDYLVLRSQRLFHTRKGDWKLIFGSGSGGLEKHAGKSDLDAWQLYNLKNDPGERENLFRKHPELEGNLEELLHREKTKQ